jgi:ABC-type nitrate/sulfonate/bicarbonate transport system substrate-binding protein
MRKACILILASISLVLALHSAEAQTKRKVVFGVPVTPPNVVHIPPYIAKEMNFFGEQNIEVELVTFEGGTQTLRGSVAGGLDITGTSSDPAIIAAARGAGTKVLGTYSHKLSQSMLVQGDIKSCKDLKGRKVGIQEVGAFNEVISRAVLASCGLTPKDVDYVPVSTKGRVAGLLSNQLIRRSSTSIRRLSQKRKSRSSTFWLICGNRCPSGCTPPISHRRKRSPATANSTSTS